MYNVFEEYEDDGGFLNRVKNYVLEELNEELEEKYRDMEISSLETDGTIRSNSEDRAYGSLRLRGDGSGNLIFESFMNSDYSEKEIYTGENGEVTGFAGEFLEDRPHTRLILYRELSEREYSLKDEVERETASDLADMWKVDESEARKFVDRFIQESEKDSAGLPEIYMHPDALEVDDGVERKQVLNGIEKLRKRYPTKISERVNNSKNLMESDIGGEMRALWFGVKDGEVLKPKECEMEKGYRVCVCHAGSIHDDDLSWDPGKLADANERIKELEEYEKMN